MEMTKRESRIFKAGVVISKIVEVLHWVGAVSLVVALIVIILSESLLSDFVLFDEMIEANGNSELECYGFSVDGVNPDGSINKVAVALLSADGIISLSLCAMIFRKLYIVLKSISRKEHPVHPFCADNIRMIKEIGIFSVAIPVTGIIISFIAMLLLRGRGLEISVSLNGFIIAVFVFCLTQVFEYGARLQNDVDGLV